jgi:hypothetical protein
MRRRLCCRPDTMYNKLWCSYSRWSCAFSHVYVLNARLIPSESTHRALPQQCTL